MRTVCSRLRAAAVILDTFFENWWLRIANIVYAELKSKGVISVELIVRHLSGSRAGQEQRFDRDVIALGRNPINDVAFDPEQDRTVSGKHAELALRSGAWILRDLNSSNGTLVDGERITERTLRPGDVVQLGKNGPRLEIHFQPATPEVEPTVVVPLQGVGGGPSLVEGRTVMMSLEDATATPGAAPGAVAAPSTARKSPALKILAAVAAVLLLLFVGLIGAVVMVRRSSAAKRASVATAQKQKAIDEAESLKLRIEAKQAQAAQTAASLQEMQTSTTTTAAGGDVQMTDMQRQLAESQRMIEELTRELQTKNDAIATAKSRPAPAPIRRQPPSKPATFSSSGTQVTSTPAVTSPQTSTPPAGRPVSTPAIGTAGTAPVTDIASSRPETPLFTGKKLKKKIYVNALAPEISPAGLPQGMARDLANSFGAALVSTGDYVVGQKGLASVSVTVTNYKADQKTTVDVKKTADSARKIGGLFGTKLPSSPADVKSYSYDSAMGARVRVYDPQGSEIASAEPYAESADRKSKFSVANVPFNQLVLSDTPTGDVARKVIGDAVEGLLQSFEALEWFGLVSSQKKDKLTLGIGRAANVDVGDVFEVYDGSRSLGRVRVTAITETSAEADLLTPTKEKLANKRLRYLGNERSGPKADTANTLTIRSKTSAMSGPGNSFQPVKELKPGTTLRFHFSVGTWARTGDRSGAFWVPLAAAKIGS